MCDFEEIQKRFYKADEDFKIAKRLKLESVAKKFTDDVNENLENFEKIKLLLKDIKKNNNINSSDNNTNNHNNNNNKHNNGNNNNAEYEQLLLVLF